MENEHTEIQRILHTNDDLCEEEFVRSTPSNDCKNVEFPVTKLSEDMKNICNKNYRAFTKEIEDAEIEILQCS